MIKIVLKVRFVTFSATSCEWIIRSYLAHRMRNGKGLNWVDSIFRTRMWSRDIARFIINVSIWRSTPFGQKKRRAVADLNRGLNSNNLFGIKI